MMEVMTSRMIHIALADQAERFELADPLSLNVEYTNASNSAIRFREPEKTWEVRLLVRLLPPGTHTGTSEEDAAVEDEAETEEEAQEVSLGRLIRVDIPDGPSSRSKEPAEEIELDPGQKYAFQYDIGRRWLDLFPPGTYELKIIDESDDNERVESNQISVAIYITAESISRLISIATSPEASYDAKTFARDWLRRFESDFDLFLDKPSDAETAENGRRVRDFEAWWSANSSTPEVIEKLESINRSAFPQDEE